MIFVNCLSGLYMTGDNLISESQLTITPAGQVDQSLSIYLSDIRPLLSQHQSVEKYASFQTLHLISFISDSLFPRASLG